MVQAAETFSSIVPAFKPLKYMRQLGRDNRFHPG